MLCLTEKDESEGTTEENRHEIRRGDVRAVTTEEDQMT